MQNVKYFRSSGCKLPPILIVVILNTVFWYSGRIYREYTGRTQKARDRHGIVSRNLGNIAMLFPSDTQSLWLPRSFDIVQIVVPLDYSGISSPWQIAVRCEQSGAEGNSLISIAVLCVTTNSGSEILLVVRARLTCLRQKCQRSSFRTKLILIPLKSVLVER